MRWWRGMRDVEDAGERLSRLRATKERQVTRLLDGMTPSQRAAIQNRPVMSWQSSWGKRNREAIRRRQVWAHRQRQLGRLDEEWADRLAAAERRVADARRELAGLSREALSMWEVHPEVYVGRTHRQLQHLARLDP